MNTKFNEATVEQAALEWFAKLGYAALHGPDIASGEPAAERDAVLRGRLQTASRALLPATIAITPATIAIQSIIF